MARMIPALFDEKTPPGEIEVFRMLAAGPDDWVALHSLDLAPWNRHLRTEIDFVVIVPRTGIVCIEVKSHENLAFENDRWFPPGISKSPFKQAQDGRFTFRRRLIELAPDLHGVPVVHLCIFPRSSFDIPQNISVQPYELIEQRQFRSSATGMDFCSLIEDKMRQGIEADPRIPCLDAPLENRACQRIVELCFPVRCFRPDARKEIEARELETESLLREMQKPVLHLAVHNPRVIVKGPAGTGKTLIAMELALRLSEQGKRVALLCFNQLIGDWLDERIRSSRAPLPWLVVGRAVSVLAKLAGITIPANPGLAFWDSQLPELLSKAFADKTVKDAAEFDYLIVDEAQDVLARPWLWGQLSELLKGGVAEGGFTLFGDFDHQALAEVGAMNDSLAELQEVARPVFWPLAENCRNYPVVGTTAVKLSGFPDNVYTGYRRSGGGLDCYGLSFYADPVSQGNELARLIRDCKGKGYNDSDIVILTFSPASSKVPALLGSRGILVHPAWQKKDKVAYASVQAFKGMERKVVILTDLDGDSHPLLRNLFYTGMTRATEIVRVVCSESFGPVLLAWLGTGETS